MSDITRAIARKRMTAVRELLDRADDDLNVGDLDTAWDHLTDAAAEANRAAVAIAELKVAMIR
jgi:hypothetical protein